MEHYEDLIEAYRSICRKHTGECICCEAHESCDKIDPENGPGLWTKETIIKFLEGKK